jgi:hypothetical protein
MAAHVRVVDVPDADRRVLQRRMRDKGVPTREVQRAPPCPRRELHVVVDNLSTTRMRRSALGSSAIPRVRLHFTPTSGSWLNLVEAFFSIITPAGAAPRPLPPSPTSSPPSKPLRRALAPMSCGKGRATDCAAVGCPQGGRTQRLQ